MRIGIAGLGFMGTTHLGVYAKLPGVDVAAVCGTVLTGSGNFERPAPEMNMSTVRKADNWEALIANPDLDAVDICLPSDLHTPAIMAAFANGKDVLCEKPLALTNADCDRILAEADKHARILMVAQILRFWPEYEYLQQWAHSGEYGAIRSATFTRRAGLPSWSSWLGDESRSGGAIVDMLIHDIDQMLLLLGMPEKVTGKSLGQADSLSASFLYPDRSLEVRLQGGWFAPGSPLQMTFQVRAERGLLELSPDGLWLTGLTGHRKRVTLPAADAFEAELAYFVECCRERRPPARCAPQGSADAVKVALLLKESRAKGGEQLAC